MPSRRQFLSVAGVALAGAPLAAYLGRGRAGVPPTSGAGRFPLERSDAEWRNVLQADAYRVLRGHGTEPPGSSPLDHEKRPGTFACAGCDQPLFSSSAKFDSGTGWPSFSAPLPGSVGTSIDRSYFMVRTEVHCARCGGHLGHVFPDGPAPTGLRYCINGVALTFVPNGV